MCPRDPRHVVSILVGEKYILIHCLVKMLAKIPLFSLNVSFSRKSLLEDKNDVNWRFMTSQNAKSRKWVLQVNGSPTRMCKKTYCPIVTVW